MDVVVVVVVVVVVDGWLFYVYLLNTGSGTPHTAVRLYRLPSPVYRITTLPPQLGDPGGNGFQATTTSRQKMKTFYCAFEAPLTAS